MKVEQCRAQHGWKGGEGLKSVPFSLLVHVPSGVVLQILKLLGCKRVHKSSAPRCNCSHCWAWVCKKDGLWEHCCEGTAGRRCCCCQSRVCITWRVMVYSTALPVSVIAMCSSRAFWLCITSTSPCLFHTTFCHAIVDPGNCHAAPGHSHNLSGELPISLSVLVLMYCLHLPTI